MKLLKVKDLKKLLEKANPEANIVVQVRDNVYAVGRVDVTDSDVFIVKK